MNGFWQSDTYRIVQKMKASGNQPGIIAHWKGMMERWASLATGPDAEAVKAWLPHWRTRALYNDDELAPIFPVLAVALGLRKMPEPAKGPARLANELRRAGLPHRVIGGRTYFAVERLHFWRDVPDIVWEEEISNAHD